MLYASSQESTAEITHSAFIDILHITCVDSSEQLYHYVTTSCEQVVLIYPMIYSHNYQDAHYKKKDLNKLCSPRDLELDC